MQEKPTIVIVYREDIPCNQPITIIKKIRDYQKNLHSMLAMQDYSTSTTNLDSLITVSLKGIKDYVDQYKDRYQTCSILTRDINGYRVLYNIQWTGEPIDSNDLGHPNSYKNDQRFLCRDN